MFLVAGSHPSGIDVSSVLVYSKRHAVVFDSLFFPQETRVLLQTLKADCMKIAALVNTHWHLDHTAGNQMFLCPIVSEARCVKLMEAALPTQLRAHSLELKGVKPSFPKDVFKRRRNLLAGDVEIDLIRLEGHTPDSLVGYLKDERILIAGDTVMELPFVAYGDSGKLIQSLKEIQSLKVKQIIQGHGGLCKIEKLSDDIIYLETCKKHVSELLESGKKFENIVGSRIENFLPPNRIKSLHKAYKETVHEANLRKIYSELRSSKEKK